MRQSYWQIQKKLVDYICSTESNEEVRKLKIDLLSKFGEKRFLENVLNVDFVKDEKSKVKYKAVSKPGMPEVYSDFVNNRMLRNEWYD